VFGIDGLDRSRGVAGTSSSRSTPLCARVTVGLMCVMVCLLVSGSVVVWIDVVLVRKLWWYWCCCVTVLSLFSGLWFFAGFVVQFFGFF